jgi:Holliday junction resolvase
MRARRTDDNHREITNEFRAHCCTVLDLSRVGQGCPDLLIARHGKSVLIEIKDGKKSPSRIKLTPDECGFHQTWKGRVEIVKSREDVATIVNSL